ncbi:hypothetical protein AB4238_07910 [Shewanella sp. 10N.286.45.A1]|uniref:hypothetical protein n=1 Tax=Shewanella sp. 10N.286.45.A1 TaxID=3229694 RepID=UPI00355274AC
MSVDFFYKEKDEIWKKITQLSNDLDELKSSIPVNVKEAAQAKKMTSEYRNRAQEAKDEAEVSARSIEELKDSIDSILSSVDKGSINLEELRARTSTAAGEVNQYHSDLIELMQSSEDTISKMVELTKQKESIESDIEAISSMSMDIASTDKRAKGLLNNIAVIKKEADVIHDELYGYETVNDETGEETHIEGTIEKLSQAYDLMKDNVEKLSTEYQGTKQDINSSLDNISVEARKSFNEHLESCDKAHNDSLNKIRKLLPDALTAGLASAYEAKTKAEEKDLKKHNSTFSKSIIVLVIISIIPFALNAVRLFQGDNLVTTIKDTPYLVFAMMPLYIPVLWMAYSANKSFKLSKRLIEEYTHKGVISKTFEGLSTQVNEIEDSPISQELKLKLLFNLVSVNSENPGKLISDYNKSDHPLMDALDKSSQMADAVVKLAKIPGFSRMARHLDEKASKVLADENQKISAAIDIQEHGEIDEKQQKQLQ